MQNTNFIYNFSFLSSKRLGSKKKLLWFILFQVKTQFLFNPKFKFPIMKTEFVYGTKQGKIRFLEFYFLLSLSLWINRTNKNSFSLFYPIKTEAYSKRSKVKILFHFILLLTPKKLVVGATS